MQNSEQLLETIREQVAHVEAAMRQDLAIATEGNDPLLTEILHYALFGGGKRMRPMLALFSHWACGGDDPDIYLLAAAFEYLHVATLLHDDVIDHAAERRGRPTVAQQYSLAAAILAGDWLHSRSTLLVGRLTGNEGLGLFSASNSGMVDGEFLQLRQTANPDTKESDYFAIIHRKTALLIAATCSISALFSKAPSAQREALHRYGLAVGSAFQIIDDLLDYTGEQQQTGKKTGNDFSEGKMTLPLITGLAAANPEQHQAMLALLQGDRDNEQAFLAMGRLLQETGGLITARNRAETLIAEALRELAIFPGEDAGKAGQGRALLAGIAHYIFQRNR